MPFSLSIPLILALSPFAIRMAPSLGKAPTHAHAYTLSRYPLNSKRTHTFLSPPFPPPHSLTQLEMTFTYHIDVMFNNRRRRHTITTRQTTTAGSSSPTTGQQLPALTEQYSIALTDADLHLATATLSSAASVLPTAASVLLAALAVLIAQL